MLGTKLDTKKTGNRHSGRATCRNGAGRLRKTTMSGQRGCQNLPRERNRGRTQTECPASVAGTRCGNSSSRTQSKRRRGGGGGGGRGNQWHGLRHYNVHKSAH